MSNQQQIFADCPADCVVMTNGSKHVYVKGKEQISNYQTFGYELAPAPIQPPIEVADAVEGPLVSSDVTANEAIAMIEENDVQFLEGFLVADEKRKSVLKAAEAKRNEPIQIVE